eukprot:TRINITY_DN2659_c0_g3_i3.p1 TRINITY_DN2659_c0_g3~~TRINITY_DN2659_c0_g3_i3.p1  ORF type:complete len:278 (+),score=-6.79 TRINITY_DN2659_c0_g3_i3:1861-2694(+)
MEFNHTNTYSTIVFRNTFNTNKIKKPRQKMGDLYLNKKNPPKKNDLQNKQQIQHKVFIQSLSCLPCGIEGHPHDRTAAPKQLFLTTAPTMLVLWPFQHSRKITNHTNQQTLSFLPTYVFCIQVLLLTPILSQFLFYFFEFIFLNFKHKTMLQKLKNFKSSLWDSQRAQQQQYYLVLNVKYTTCVVSRTWHTWHTSSLSILVFSHIQIQIKYFKVAFIISELKFHFLGVVSQYQYYILYQIAISSLQKLTFVGTYKNINLFRSYQDRRDVHDYFSTIQ